MRPHVFTTDRDREAARLGEKGFSTQYITQETGLSSSQVQYRGRESSRRSSAALIGSRATLRAAIVSPLRKSERRIPALFSSSRLTARMAGDAFAFYHP